MQIYRWSFPIIISVCFTLTVFSSDRSGGKFTAADYLRAERFLSWNAGELVYGAVVNPQWMDDDKFWYRNRFREGHEFVLVDPQRGSRERAFNHVRLAAALSEVSEKSYEPFSLPFTRFVFQRNMREISFIIDNEEWRCDLDSYKCDGPFSAPVPVSYSVESPDGQLAAFIKDYNLWTKNLETEEEVQLTEDGEKYYGYATDSQGWTRSERPILLWSPDSRKIATYRLDERGVEKIPLIETAEGRPVLHYWPYVLPGDTVVPMLERVVVHVEDPRVVFLNVEPDHQRTSNCCNLTRNGDWADVEWSEDGSRLAFLSTSRDYKEVKLRVADPNTGEVRTVYEERANTFFESNLSSRGVPNWRVLHDSNEFIWFTRREGWGHLYLYDLRSGELKNRITAGAWNVLDILSINERNRRIYFTGVGRKEGSDPYYRYFYRVGFDGRGLQLLSSEEADHLINFSPSGAYFVDRYSKIDTPPVTAVRRADGREVLTLEQGDIAALREIGWREPIPFRVKGSDGVTDIYGVMYLPSNFDENKKYPIINSIYPGPQVGSVGPRSFSVTARGQTQALAELGFVVVQIDALGSSALRSKAFHVGWYGNMGDNGLEDQVAAMKHLAARHSWIDLNRVGIYGHSGGGFAAAGAMLRYPDFFHVAVSSAGNHDNRGYTYYWGEKYQGLLERNDDGTDNYLNQANHLLAGNLKGKLLITYGTMDSNVHPNMTLLLINELIRENKDFDVMVFPNRSHGYFNEPYNIRITWDYFVRHLLGKEPPPGYMIER